MSAEHAPNEFASQVRSCPPPSEGRGAPCPSIEELFFCQSVSADFARQNSSATQSEQHEPEACFDDPDTHQHAKHSWRLYLRNEKTPPPAAL